MRCKNCNAPLINGQTFCSNCGAPVNTVKAASGKADNKKTGLIIAIICCSVLLVAAVILLIILVMSGKSPANNGERKSSKPQTTESKTQENAVIPPEIAGSYFFTSGAGGWGTSLEINKDFTFSGCFSDYDFDCTYICEFTGEFSDIEKIDDYTYKLTLKSLTPKHPGGYTYWEDGTYYQCESQPYGLEDCDVFYVYLKGRQMKDLSEEFMSWLHMSYSDDMYSSTLESTCIRNTRYDYGFVKEQETEEPVSTQLTKAEMQSLADSKIGNVACLEYHDYDKDGTYEAFVVCSTFDFEGYGDIPWKLFFIYSDGTIELIYTETENSFYNYYEDGSYYLETSDYHGFFSYDKGGYGSGWLTDVYTVKDGKPKRLNSSGLQGFYKNDDGIICTTKNEFLEEGGHLYPEYELIYDSSTCEFSIGRKLSDGYQ